MPNLSSLLDDRAHLGAVVVVRGRLVRHDGEYFLRDADHEVPLAFGGEGALPRVASGASRSRAIDGEDGDIVEITGEWDGRMLTCSGVEVLTRSGRDVDGAHADHSAIRARHAALRLRNGASIAVRKFFDDADFIEVETPSMVPSPGLDLHLQAFKVEGVEARYLITSPEYQMKRVLAGGLERIYQVSRCFRQSELGSRHEPEFTLVEWYRAFAGSSEVMADTERLVASVALATLGTTVLPCGADVAPPWPRRRLADVFEASTGRALMDVLPDEEDFFRLYVDQVEPSLGVSPVFLTHWPASMASLARLHPDEPKFADRFEAFVGGMELCNGFGELVDATEQRRRLVRDRNERRDVGLPAYPVDERFLACLEEGIPPSGGNALGFDRLIMLLLGAEHIEDVVAIPYRRL